MNDMIDKLHRDIPGSKITYVSEGAKMRLSIRAKLFTSMSRLERQRYVKKLLSPWINSGELHAVTMQIEGDECGD